MGFLDKVKQSAEQATAKAKEGVSGVQTKRELGQAHTELGETAFRLADSGAISHPELDPIVERIRSLKAELEDAGGDEAGSANGEPAGVQDEQTVGTGESTT
jgi:hypothetical protein